MTTLLFIVRGPAASAVIRTPVPAEDWLTLTETPAPPPTQAPPTPKPEPVQPVPFLSPMDDDWLTMME